MRAHLNYCGSYEPAIPPIVRIDGFTEDLPGGGIRFDIPVVVADGLKSNASQTVSQQLLGKQLSVRMEALASLKSALVNESVCGRSITEEIGASLSNLIEKETHRKCLSKTLGVVCLAAKADPHCKS
ncbi:hypothetical protein FOZ63_005119, partial [Perkinsus olseni]